MNNQNCPCGSNKAFNECCEPLISGARAAPTAEALMRSRYTAYTLRDDDYLLRSWHSTTRPDENPSDDQHTRWTGLKVVRTEAGQENDDTGIVEFIATCTVKGVASQLHEISHFSRENGVWVYVDGEGQQPVRREQAKVGRNDPCPCGSGRKFKKCCGA